MTNKITEMWAVIGIIGAAILYFGWVCVDLLRDIRRNRQRAAEQERADKQAKLDRGQHRAEAEAIFANNLALLSNLRDFFDDHEIAALLKSYAVVADGIVDYAEADEPLTPGLSLYMDTMLHYRLQELALAIVFHGEFICVGVSNGLPIFEATSELITTRVADLLNPSIVMDGK